MKRDLHIDGNWWGRLFLALLAGWLVFYYGWDRVAVWIMGWFL